MAQTHERVQSALVPRLGGRDLHGKYRAIAFLVFAIASIALSLIATTEVMSRLFDND